jgi:hypothetical protein
MISFESLEATWFALPNRPLAEWLKMKNPAELTMRRKAEKDLGGGGDD